MKSFCFMAEVIGNRSIGTSHLSKTSDFEKVRRTIALQRQNQYCRLSKLVSESTPQSSGASTSSEGLNPCLSGRSRSFWVRDNFKEFSQTTDKF